MGTVMCDSRLQAILLLCAAVSVSAELLVEDPDGEGAKVDAQRGQMEPVMVEVQRPSREEPRVEGRMVKTMTSPSQVWAAVWDGLKGKITPPPRCWSCDPRSRTRTWLRPEIVTTPTIDSWKLNFRLKKDGGISRIFPTSGYSPQYGYHLVGKRGRVGRDPNYWIRLLKTQEDGTGQIAPIPQVLRLGKRSLKRFVPSARTVPYWLSYWNSEHKWEDSFHSWQKAMIDENLSKEAQNTDMRRVLHALGAMIAEDE